MSPLIIGIQCGDSPLANAYQADNPGIFYGVRNGKYTFSVIKHVEKPTVGEIPTNALHVKCCAIRGRVKNWLENNHPYILHLIKIISPIRDKVIVTIRQILKAL